MIEGRDIGDELNISSGFWFPSKREIRDVLRTGGGLYHLMPNPDFFGKDETIVTIGNENYSAHDMEKMFKDI